jgi:hypothetical protein
MAGEEQSSDNQRTLLRQYCKGVVLGGLPYVWERKIWNIWPPSSSTCNFLNYFILGIFSITYSPNPSQPPEVEDHGADG